MGRRTKTGSSSESCKLSLITALCTWKWRYLEHRGKYLGPQFLIETSEIWFDHWYIEDLFCASGWAGTEVNGKTVLNLSGVQKHERILNIIFPSPTSIPSAKVLKALQHPLWTFPPLPPIAGQWLQWPLNPVSLLLLPESKPESTHQQMNISKNHTNPNTQ